MVTFTVIVNFAKAVADAATNETAEAAAAAAPTATAAATTAAVAAAAAITTAIDDGVNTVSDAFNGKK